MRWGDFRRSDNVEDRTDMPAGGGGFPLGGGMRLGGGAIIVIVIVGMLFGINPLEMLGLLSGGPSVQAPAPAEPAPGYGPQRSGGSDPQKDFVAAILGDTEDVWGAQFQSMGSRYDPPKLVLFRGRVQSSCGLASAASGPFYCPADRRVFLDTEFFDELSRRFGAPGDFARAYVIAHEVGHHVQNLTGIMGQFDREASRADSRSRNALSVRLELQADCYAGVWGHSAKQRGVLDTSDIDAGIRAAQAVGDDRLQKQSQGYVVPESFTHGSAEQRARWFRTGLDSGDIRRCNTFAAGTP
jgi:predicted metalloprotease